MAFTCLLLSSSSAQHRKAARSFPPHALTVSVSILRPRPFASRRVLDYNMKSRDSVTFSVNSSSSTQPQSTSRAEDSNGSGRGQNFPKTATMLSNGQGQKIDLQIQSNGFQVTVNAAGPTRRQLTGVDALPIVETAFLSSVAFLAYALSSLVSGGVFKSIAISLSGLPIIISMIRWADRQGLMCLACTGAFLFLLRGPIGVLQYTVGGGITGLALGYMWKRKWPHAASVLAGTCVKTLCYILQIKIGSAIIGIDVLSLIANFFGKALTKVFKRSFPLIAVKALMVFVFAMCGLFQVYMLHLIADKLLPNVPKRPGDPSWFSCDPLPAPTPSRPDHAPRHTPLPS